MRPTTEDVQAASDAVLFPGKSKLTAKQRKFARAVAMGETKAQAYREAYNVTSPASLTSNPYHLSNDSRVKAEIAAIEEAIAAQAYQTPAALRSLVVNSLVKVITNPDSKPGQITAAAKVLGTVTEVAAFTERKEVRTISTSEDARARIMDELRNLVKAQAEDAQVIDAAADSLLAELMPSESTPKSSQAEPHPPGTPQDAEGTPASGLHMNTHEQNLPHTDSENSQPDTPTPSIQEDPPVDGT